MTSVIGTETLTEWLDSPALRILDLRYSLLDGAWGRRQFESSHIAGAQYVDLAEDLSGPVIEGRTGRHPLPNADRFVETLRRLGVSNDSRVVLYDDSGYFATPRLWWMLSLWLGHQQVSILQGGFQGWLRSGGKVCTQVRSVSLGDFQPTIDPAVMVAAAELPEFVNTGGILLDARAPERFRGGVEPLDKKAGHIPGARCLPCSATVDSAGEFLAREQLGELFGHVRGKDVVYYCGSGVSACQSILAMVLAGLPPARLFPGSWSEWIANPQRPIATTD